MKIAKLYCKILDYILIVNINIFYTMSEENDWWIVHIYQFYHLESIS